MARIKYKEAVGLKVKRGKPPIGKKPEKKELQKLYTKESMSIREIAELLGCTKDMVARALAEYGIERRAKQRISRLANYSLAELWAAVEQEGYETAAKRFGVGKTTLFFYLKRRDTEKG